MIRDATLADLPAIVEIYNASIPGRLATADTTPVTVESRRAWFDAHEPGLRPIWVLEEEGDIAGWLDVHPFYGRAAYEATVEVAVYVAPAFQGRGVGRRLLREMISRARQFGIINLLAFVFAHNDPSMKLFESEGFVRWGHLPRVAKLDGVERDLVILGLRVENR